MILTLGRLATSEQYKGIDEILEAMPSLLKLYPNLLYVIAGDGDDKKRLIEKVSSLNLNLSVKFLGFVPEESKADLYRSADVFVMPSRGEGFGFVFLEALACGTPVIASTKDGSLEAVRYGELGQAVDPDDQAALIEALIYSLKRPRGIPRGLDYFSYPEFKRRVERAISLVIRK